MPYTATNDLSALDATLPIGASEPVSILDDALRETRLCLKTVVQAEHTPTGAHKAGILTATMLADNAVTTNKILDANVTLTKLAAGVLSGANLTAATVTATQLANDAVTTNKILAANVTSAKIATDGVETANIKALNVTIPKIGGMTAGKILIGQAGGGALEYAPSGILAMTAAGVFTLNNLPISKWSDTKTVGTVGGTFTSGAWQLRDLQTEDSDLQNLGTLAANQLTLIAGTYFFYIVCPAFNVGWHKARLYNATDAAVVQVGSSAISNEPSIIIGIVTVAASKALQIEHQCQTTQASNGLGYAANIAAHNEIYTQAFFLRIA